METSQRIVDVVLGALGKLAPERSVAACQGSMNNLAIGGVEISDAGVIWDDQQTAARYEISGLNLRTGAIAPGQAVPVELELLVDSAQPKLSGPLAFAATIALSPINSRRDTCLLSVVISFGFDLASRAKPSFMTVKTRSSASFLIE